MCTPRPRGTLSAETNFNSTLPSNTTLFPSLAGNHTVVGPNSRSRHLFTPQIHHRALGQVLPLLSNFDRNRDLNHVAPPQQRPTTTFVMGGTHTCNGRSTVNVVATIWTPVTRPSWCLQLINHTHNTHPYHTHRIHPCSMVNPPV